MRNVKSALFSCLLIALILIPAACAYAPVKAEDSTAKQIKVGVRLVNVEKVDLAANSYKLDFYLWFDWDPEDFTIDQVKDFEFLNGAPSKDIVYVSDLGFLQYRVKGEFIKTFDFTRYPFETHTLEVKIEHKSMNSTALIYVVDPDSSLDSSVNVVGWTLKGFQPFVAEHKFSGNSMSNFGFDLQVERPFFSSFVKNVVPITIITLISFLTFLIAAKNVGQRIGLAVSTLMAASAFHISLLSGLPQTGYLTYADKMMIIVYILFLYNLGVSVWIMKLVDQGKPEEGDRFNAKAWKVLVALAVTLIGLVVLL